jgi:hypothetical protein
VTPRAGAAQGVPRRHETAQGRSAVGGARRAAAAGLRRHIRFRRPGKFRWTYEKPFEQLIVGDGTRVWVYDRDLNQVIVRKLDIALGATPAALLAGDNALEKNFTLTEGRRPEISNTSMRYRRRRSRSSRVRSGFRDNLPRAMELTDAFGQITTLTFTHVRAQPALAPTLFRSTFLPVRMSWATRSSARRHSSNYGSGSPSTRMTSRRRSG